jgi:hypothetical protein
VFKKEKESMLDQRRRQQYTHTVMTDLTLAEPNEYKYLLQLDGLQFDELLKAVIPAIAKRGNNLLEMFSNS